MVSRLLAAPVEQARRDLRRPRTALAWALLAGWSALVTALHAYGLSEGVYTAVPWWDLLTHTTGGVGVAAFLWLSYRRHGPPSGAPLWLVPAVLLIGAGFEVYEYLFKSFWWEWTLRYYAVDTVIDLALDAAGAGVVTVAVAARGAWISTDGTATEPAAATTESFEG